MGEDNNIIPHFDTVITSFCDMGQGGDTKFLLESVCIKTCTDRGVTNCYHMEGVGS